MATLGRKQTMLQVLKNNKVVSSFEVLLLPCLGHCLAGDSREGDPGEKSKQSALELLRAKLPMRQGDTGSAWKYVASQSPEVGSLE